MLKINYKMSEKILKSNCLKEKAKSLKQFEISKPIL